MEGRGEMLALQGNLEQFQVTEGHVPGWLGIEFTLGLRCLRARPQVSDRSRKGHGRCHISCFEMACLLVLLFLQKLHSPRNRKRNQ